MSTLVIAILAFVLCLCGLFLAVGLYALWVIVKVGREIDDLHDDVDHTGQ